MSGEMVPPQYSPSHAARSFTIRGRAKCALPKARFRRGALSSRARSAVSRDAKRNLVNKMQLLVLTFGMRIPIGYSTLPPPRGHHFAYRSNQYRLQANRLQAVFSYEQRNGSPGYFPSVTTSARSPLAVLFCSALALRRGSVHALSKSFASFGASRNAQVPLRYTSQPFRRKIYAKSFAQCFVITFI